MFLFANYPSWIHPEIFPGVPVLGLLRWYGLMYIFAFGTAYMVLKQTMKEGMLDSKGFKCTEDDLFSFISTGIIFLLIGARVFSWFSGASGKRNAFSSGLMQWFAQFPLATPLAASETF